MKIIVVGVGQNLWNEKEKMRMIAGKKGTVLLYRDFTKFSQSLDEIFEAMCGKDLLSKSSGFILRVWICM